MNSNRGNRKISGREKISFCVRERAIPFISPFQFPKFVKSVSLQSGNFFQKEGFLLYLYRAKKCLCNLYSLDGKTGLSFVQNREALQNVQKSVDKRLDSLYNKGVPQGRAIQNENPAKPKRFEKNRKKCLTKNPNGAILIAYQTTAGRKQIRPTTKGDLYESRILPVLHENR